MKHLNMDIPADIKHNCKQMTTTEVDVLNDSTSDIFPEDGKLIVTSPI